jgi:hypothetical protein
MIGNLHPLFSSILASAAQVPEQVARAEYVSRLTKMDWAFEIADDGAVYRKGRAELSDMMKLRESIDADHQLWNRHAPSRYRTVQDVCTFQDFAGNAPATVEWIAGYSGPLVIAVVVDTTGGPRSIHNDLSRDALARYQAKAEQIAAQKVAA